MTEILICLKNALFDKKQKLPENMDWQQLRQEAKLQTVDALVYSYLKSKENIDKQDFSKWEAKTVLQLAKYTQCYTNHVFVAELFEKERD